MKGKIGAMSMEAKASAAIIAALPFGVAAMTYMTSPDYISLLWTTQIDKVALGAAAVWMTIGVTVMRKMINFEKWGPSPTKAVLSAAFRSRRPARKPSHVRPSLCESQRPPL